MIVANLFDMLDGNVARLSGKVTKYGGFLDSSLDRTIPIKINSTPAMFFAMTAPHRTAQELFGRKSCW